jgi:hypothetical protein
MKIALVKSLATICGLALPKPRALEMVLVKSTTIGQQKGILYSQ